MKKSTIPNEEEIRKGIIGKSMGGVNYKVIISRIEEKYYTAFEVQREMESCEPGKVLKPGDLFGVRKQKDHISALRIAIKHPLGSREW